MQSILGWHMLTYLSLGLGILLATVDNTWAQIYETWAQEGELAIRNRVVHGKPFHNKTHRTKIDGGYSHSDMLNRHYFPGLKDYIKGYYSMAEQQMIFAIKTNWALDKNPRKNEYLSKAYYILGMVYFYHASGGRRLMLAKQNFDNSIRWDQRNYLAYLELARLLSSFELRAEATMVLERLLQLQLGEEVAQQARVELARLQSKKP